jgi:hypothetical protein
MQTLQSRGDVSAADAPLLFHRGNGVSQEKEYASFSSLIWKRVPQIPHCWRWKQYFVWGIGCIDQDVAQQMCAGGRWYTNLLERRGPYVSQAGAQAVVESYHLDDNPPASLMDLVDEVWEVLHETRPTLFEEISAQLGIDELTLSDALAEGYEKNLIDITLRIGGVGYRRARKLK